MGCSEGLARILVFVANFAFLLVGLALLVVGVVYKVNFTKYTDAIPDEYSALQHVPTLAIIIGAIIFVIAFLGCCGALKSNTCMLTWYGAILIVIFLLQVGLGIFALIQIKDTNDLETKIANQLAQLFGKYNSNEQITEVVNLIQQNFQCCGTTSSSSWGTNIPNSCYPDKDTTQSIYSIGCSNVVPQYLSSSIKLIAILALAISVTEILGAVLAICLAGCIRESRRQGAYC